MKMMHMNTSQKNPVRISKSLKKRSVFPRSTATNNPKLIMPSSIKSIQAISRK